MHQRIISAILLAFVTAVYSPEVMKGQSIDSLLYVIENDLIKDDAERYDLLAIIFTEIDDAESKIRYSDQAIDLAHKLEILPALPLLVKGEAYLNSGKHALALECFIQSANHYAEMGDRAGLGMTYLSMAETYNLQGNSENEKLYIQRSIEIFEQERDSFSLGFALHNLAYFNYSKGQYDTALLVYSETLDLFENLDDPYAPQAYFTCLGNMGLVYSRLSDFVKAEEHLLLAIDKLTSLGDEWAVAEFTIEYAKILEEKGETRKAIVYASRVLNAANIPEIERDASRLLAQLYEVSGRYDSAYYYQSIFIVANDSTKNIETVQKMADLRTEYEIGKKQAEVDVLEKNKLINTIVIIGLGIILLLAIGLVTLYSNNLKRSKKLSKALEERRVLLEKHSSQLKEKNDEILGANEELTVLNEAISKQKNEILDSITYAERIQAAMLPPEQYFLEILNDVFILFKPRDIVSGDFYWIKHVNQYVILAAADCTGHGVPGAFMSLLGISFLNEIVQRREITQANQVLNELRKQIRTSLRQHGQADESKDGIDMALCVIDEKNNLLQFSGANNSLYLVRDKNGAPELTEFKADRMPLGYYPGRFTPFTNTDIHTEYGDVFYLFSDGFVDQKGGLNNRKFLSKNFKELLIQIHQEPMQEQKSILEKTITDWMGNHSQIDDIMVIGVRI